MILLYFVFTILFTSCGDEVHHKKTRKYHLHKHVHQNQGSTKKKNLKDQHTTIFDNLKITDQVELFKLSENDELTFEITGKLYLPNLSIHKKEVQSTWIEKFCFDPDKHDRTISYFKEKTCFDIEREGKCSINYQYFDGYKEIELNMPTEKLKNNLILKVGEQTLTFGKLLQEEKRKLIFNKIITGEHIEKNNLLVIQNIYKDPYPVKQKIGLHSYNDCEGLGYENFDHEGEKEFEEKVLEWKKEYLLKVQLKDR